jgi:hypothetical protein
VIDVPIERLTGPRDLFRCLPYACVMSAGACIRRRAKALAATEYGDRLTTDKCRACPDGPRVAELVPLEASAPVISREQAARQLGTKRSAAARRKIRPEQKVFVAPSITRERADAERARAACRGRGARRRPRDALGTRTHRDLKPENVTTSRIASNIMAKEPKATLGMCPGLDDDTCTEASAPSRDPESALAKYCKVHRQRLYARQWAQKQKEKPGSTSAPKPKSATKPPPKKSVAPWSEGAGFDCVRLDVEAVARHRASRGRRGRPSRRSGPLRAPGSGAMES